MWQLLSLWLNVTLCCQTTCLSQTIPTTLPTIPYLGTPCPNIANPGNTLPQCSQPWDGPFTLVFPSPWYLSLHHYLLWSCYLVVSLSPLFFIVLIVLPLVTLYTYPRYLGSLSCTRYLILDITNAPLTCFSVSCLSSLSPGGALLSVVVLCGWASSSQLQLSLAPILLLT